MAGPGETFGGGQINVWGDLRQDFINGDKRKLFSFHSSYRNSASAKTRYVRGETCLRGCSFPPAFLPAPGTSKGETMFKLGGGANGHFQVIFSSQRHKVNA